MLNNRRTQIVLAIIILGVAGLGFILYLNMRPESPIADVVQFPRPARGHDDTIVFDELEAPPAGGEHSSIWQNCGIYNEPIRTGYAVHSLEHGAIWITYQTGFSADEVAMLESMVRGQSHMLISPFPGQSSPIVLTAWGVSLEIDSANDDRIEPFIERYRMGSQSPEPGAACTQGVGEPLP
ncbi:hypothetical protein MNBD_CHLOROFLEXI01-1640 [hydrothermal vent metagenome]|uniref:DUF3105 domain-containing protein n=1 Tax=hydrothermal vent metagenome TaxID=652676 RepID=A0A3B0V6F0_9ZZZZ